MTTAKIVWLRLTMSVLTACLIGIAVEGVSAQTIGFELVGTITGPADMVRVQGQHAYVVDDKTITAVDISNPAMPKRGGSYAFPEKIWGFRVAGSEAYIAADFFGLGIVDVSNPAALTLKGSFKTKGQAHGVAMFGNKALVTDHMAGVEFIDVSNKAKPARADSFFLEGYARDVVVSGSSAYAVDSPKGFYIFDLNRQGPLESIGSLQAGDSFGQGVTIVADPSSKVVCVAGGRAGLEVFDVSNPEAPKLVGSLMPPSGRPGRVALRGQYAYLADGAAGLQVVDLSTPSKPTIVATYKTAEAAKDVALSDSLIFVVVGNREGAGEVIILRQTR